jgi:uncharacterized membrane protein (UPF0127 family)
MIAKRRKPEEGILLERTGALLVSHVQWMRTSGEQARGLMFSSRKNDFCPIFPLDPPRRELLHMWFVFYPIDVVSCDTQGMVLSLKSRFLPFSLYHLPQPAAYILELPVGTIRCKDIRIGDTLSWSTSAQTI